MPATINFDVPRLDAHVIREIATRAHRELTTARKVDPFTILDVTMDVTAVHANGCPLRLQDLLDADGLNFAHDILGIRRHLNRATGRLPDTFSPRFSRREA